MFSQRWKNNMLYYLMCSDCCAANTNKFLCLRETESLSFRKPHFMFVYLYFYLVFFFISWECLSSWLNCYFKKHTLLSGKTYSNKINYSNLPSSKTIMPLHVLWWVQLCDYEITVFCWHCRSTLTKQTRKNVNGT